MRAGYFTPAVYPAVESKTDNSTLVYECRRSSDSNILRLQAFRLCSGFRPYIVADKQVLQLSGRQAL